MGKRLAEREVRKAFCVGELAEEWTRFWVQGLGGQKPAL